MDCYETDTKKSGAALLAAALLVVSLVLPMLNYFKIVLRIAALVISAAFPALSLMGKIKSGHVFCEELLVFSICGICIILKEFVSAALVMILYMIILLLASYAHMYAYSRTDTIPDAFAGIDERYLYDTLNSSVAVPGKTERKVSVFFNYAVPAVTVLILLFSIIVPVFKGNFAEKAVRGAAILLCFCPMGLLESLSLAFFRGVEGIFESGGVIKDTETVEKLAKVKNVICNKTGTVTESIYTVSDVHSVGISERNLLSLCARIESQTNHPIGRAICDYIGLKGELSEDLLKTEEIPGRGIIAESNGSTFLLGNAALLFENGINCLMPGKNGTSVHLAVNGKYCGYILLENKVRESSYNAVEQLRDNGVETVTMLSCDLRSIARTVASVLNFDSLKAELKGIDEKISSVRYIEENKNTGMSVAYIGNSTDEAEASAYADISIATGLKGQEDKFPLFSLCFPTEGISAVPSAMRFARKAARTARVNIAVCALLRIAVLIFILCGIAGINAAALVTALGAAFAFLNSGFLFDK